MDNEYKMLVDKPLFGAQLNLAHPLVKGLVGCWIFNDMSGIQLTDYSPYKNHGILTGWSSPVPRPTNGQPFGAVDTVVTMSASNMLNGLGTTGDYTMMVEAWFNPFSLGENNAERVFNKGGNLEIYIQATNKAGFSTKTGTVTKNAVSADNSIPFNTLNCVFGIKTPTDIRIITNGTSVTGSAVTAAIDDHSASVLRLGDLVSSNRCFDGKIYIVRAWNLLQNNYVDVCKELYRNPYSPMGIPMFI
jgi:hypothetical protein